MISGVNIIGYARVSTDDKGQSIDGQKAEIMKWAKAHNSTVVNFYYDEMSGAAFPRPGLSMALMDIQLGAGDYLLCYDQSRLTRDAENHLWRIKLFVKNIIYVADGDLEPGTLSADLLHAIKGVTDKEERRILGLRTKIGMEAKRNAGKHVGRPLTLALKEETDGALSGRIVSNVTTVLSRSQVLFYASMGMSPNYLAKNIVHTTSATVYSFLDRNNLKGEYYETMKKAGFNFKGV